MGTSGIILLSSITPFCISQICIHAHNVSLLTRQVSPLIKHRDCTMGTTIANECVYTKIDFALLNSCLLIQYKLCTRYACYSWPLVMILTVHTFGRPLYLSQPAKLVRLISDWVHDIHENRLCTLGLDNYYTFRNSLSQFWNSAHLAISVILFTCV